MATPHIEANPGDVAGTVLMPGDPLRAKYIAEKFLENSKQFNRVRGMLGFTGTYRGNRISVMGHGMGQPSIGIYSYELYKFFNVENIIRVGSCGAFTEDLDLFDILLVEEAYTDSTYAKIQCGNTKNILKPSLGLLEKLENTADQLGMLVKKGRVDSSDVFYNEDADSFKRLRDEEGCLAVEMESFALFSNAITLGKKAACILTVSDHFLSERKASSSERETGFNKMITLALETAVH